MIKPFLKFLMLCFALAASTVVLALPGYYDEDKFQDVGRIDGIDRDNNTVIINDIPYSLSDSVTVYSLSSRKDTVRRLRFGSYVAFRTRGGQLIVEVWMLPDNYKPARRR